MYDIIGDLHGFADPLRRLLAQLGYEERDGAWRHAERTAVFVGDFVDRGEEIAEVLEIVRSMTDAGAALAVMGNHEFNAVAYRRERVVGSGEYLREHSQKNLEQHKETLAQLSEEQLDDWTRWFQTLPMWLELPGLRIVHACWDPHSMAIVSEHHDRCGGFTDEFFRAACVEDSELFDAVEVLLKGKELELPDGVSFEDKGGHERHAVRVKWYEDPLMGGGTYRGHSFYFKQDDRQRIPDAALEPEALAAARPYGAGEPPVFFGHFWMPGDQTPARLASNVACLDYSVAHEGRLCAYRWNGETLLQDVGFVSVPGS